MDRKQELILIRGDMRHREIECAQEEERIMGISFRGIREGIGYIVLNTKAPLYVIRSFHVPCTFSMEHPRIEFDLRNAYLFGKPIELTSTVTRSNHFWYKESPLVEWINEDKIVLPYLDDNGNITIFYSKQREDAINKSIKEFTDEFPNLASKLRVVRVKKRHPPGIAPSLRDKVKDDYLSLERKINI